MFTRHYGAVCYWAVQIYRHTGSKCLVTFLSSSRESRNYSECSYVCSLSMKGSTARDAMFTDVARLWLHTP